jgi:hypothetical protein
LRPSGTDCSAAKSNALTGTHSCCRRRLDNARNPVSACAAGTGWARCKRLATRRRTATLKVFVDQISRDPEYRNSPSVLTVKVAVLRSAGLKPYRCVFVIARNDRIPAEVSVEAFEAAASPSASPVCVKLMRE